MRNAGLDEAQAEIKISGRTTNSHGYADDTTLMAESEEATDKNTGKNVGNRIEKSKIKQKNIKD